MVLLPQQPRAAGLARVKALLKRAASVVPPGVRVILMVDRGLAWPLVIDLCRRFGWHFVLRVQGKTRVRLVDDDGRGGGGGGCCCAIIDLLNGGRDHWLGSGEAFKKAGWRTLSIVARRNPRRGRDPWLLVSDLPPSLSLCDCYRKRMWQEESFRDEKSSGFAWQSSRVRDPRHAERLLLAMALATLWVLSIGTEALRRRDWRGSLEPLKRRVLSVFQLGRRRLMWCCYHDRNPMPCLTLRPP